MWFRNRAWIPVAWFLSAVNAAAVWFAAAPAEPLHATLHAAFAVAFGVGAQRLAARRQLEAQRAQLFEALDQNAALEEAHEAWQVQVRDLEDRLRGAEQRLDRGPGGG